MSVEENKTIVRRFLNEAWNNRDLTVLDEVIADDYVAHDPSAPSGEIRGCEALKEVLRQARVGMPDAKIQIEDVLGEGDRTLIRFTVYGTHLGDLFGIPASGRQVNVATLLVSRFTGARIVEEWAIKDMLGLLQQVGAIPMQGAAPAGAAS
jgi:steroid delta-isomerase-like uncharacterized protein